MSGNPRGVPAGSRRDGNRYRSVNLTQLRGTRPAEKWDMMPAIRSGQYVENLPRTIIARQVVEAAIEEAA